MLPSLKTTQSSSGQPHMTIGTTCLGEYLHSSNTNNSKRERAFKKRKLTAEATAMMTIDIIKQAIPSKSAPNQWATTPQHHEDPTQLHGSSLNQGNPQHHENPTQLHKSSLHQGNPQHHEDSTQLHESSLHQGNVQNNIEPATPSQIWHNDLISILQKIMATPCPPPTKPIFEFDLSIEAASKN